MEQHKTYDPDTTVTINAGRGPARGMILGVLGFLVALAAVVAVGVVSLDLVADDLGDATAPSTVQEQDAGGH